MWIYSRANEIWLQLSLVCRPKSISQKSFISNLPDYILASRWPKHSPASQIQLNRGALLSNNAAQQTVA